MRNDKLEEYARSKVQIWINGNLQFKGTIIDADDEFIELEGDNGEKNLIARREITNIKITENGRQTRQARDRSYFTADT